ncbi:MAG: TnpV protein [Lachnospiraceae bacterium]
MKKYIVGENGISYTLGADGMYYPDLKLPEGTNYQIGRYGRMRAAYLKEYKHSLYLELVFAGKWNEYLHNVDEECYQMMELLIKQIKEKQGVTEPIKAENQMLCVGMVNNIRHSAEEVVLAEMIYI